ncbi:MAG: hypothetical protein EB034_00270 [Verrucomicrobia bacterium]|nr:hypothetical protein [Verrucomicrobiota bacterium]
MSAGDCAEATPSNTGMQCATAFMQPPTCDLLALGSAWQALVNAWHASWETGAPLLQSGVA